MKLENHWSEKVTKYQVNSDSYEDLFGKLKELFRKYPELEEEGAVDSVVVEPIFQGMAPFAWVVLKEKK